MVIEVTKWACLNSKAFAQHRKQQTRWKCHLKNGRICLQMICPTRDLSPTFSSVEFLSLIWLFATPFTKAHQASLSFTISQSLLKLMYIGSVMPFNHPIICCPLLLPSIFPSRRVFSSESALPISCPKYWSFSFSISPSNEYSGLISFRIVSLSSLRSKWLSRVFSNTTVQKHQFFDTQPSLWSSFMVLLYGPYMTTGKIIALIICTVVGKLMTLLLIILCRFVTGFHPRNKHLLISWLQSRSTAIL